ncbi:MAG: hypothetical protein ACOX81_03440 [Candidatus Heteroscillospira sp.]|jgi:type II secretory pathway pseudopilin PulG
MNVRRDSLLLAELVLNILIFALCAAACAAVLMRASAISRESRELTAAVYIAQTAAESFGGEDCSVYFDENGLPVSGDGAYEARCSRDGDTLIVSVINSAGDTVYTLRGWGGERP